ncbi:MAG: ATP-binding protein [Bacteroidia bacterium]|nr:ATP-binding protein [Bacteroidia bacterium]
MRSFRVKTIIRVLILSTCIALVTLMWNHEGWFLMRYLMIGLAVIVLVELIRYVEKTSRDLANFLLAIKHKDFTFSSALEHRGKAFEELKAAFTEIIHSFQHLRAEKESHYQYLQNVVEHVSVALICYSESGKIELMNQAAKNLLNRPYMSNIQSLGRVNPELLATIESLQHGQRQLLRTAITEDLHSIALQATEFKLQEKHFKLISLQDIHSELDEKEIDTWQKLIRVLTHEIMNSVTPIVSLSKVVSTLMTDEQGQRLAMNTIEEEDADDILESIRVIESRSKGLLHFVHAYRNLTRAQKANVTLVTAEELLDRVCLLLSPELDKRMIVVHREASSEVSFTADAQLIEQVLINLIKNAMEALEGRDHPQIWLSSGLTNDQRPFLRVRDNGPGIEEEYIDKIYIPFFTTKKKGSGIGLSLSRQIMRQHGGSIHFQLHPEGGTSFLLVF